MEASTTKEIGLCLDQFKAATIFLISEVGHGDMIIWTGTAQSESLGTHFSQQVGSRIRNPGCRILRPASRTLDLGFKQLITLLIFQVELRGGFECFPRGKAWPLQDGGWAFQSPINKTFAPLEWL